MTVLDFGLLVVAGFFAGLIGFVTGLASLVSYPALLAVGLPAVSANVTNTVALVAAGVGAIAAVAALAERTRRAGDRIGAAGPAALAPRNGGARLGFRLAALG